MRRRILRATVVAVVCAVLLFAVPLGIVVLRLYQQDEVRELQQLGEQVAVSLPARPVQPPGSAPVELPRAERGTRIAVYDPGARRVLGDGPRAGDGPVREAARGRASSQRLNDSLVVAVPVGGAERVRAMVRVSAPASQPLRRTALTWSGMLALAGLAVGTGVVLALRSSRRLARPLEALAGTARRMEGGDLGARAEPSGIPETDAVASALARTAGRVDQLLQRERSFSADVSHQLRTALTGVRLDLETSLAAGDGGDPREAMTSALERLGSMETTLADLLILARDAPERATLDLAPLLDDVARRWHGELAAQGRRLRVLAEDDLPEGAGSGRAARQILDVLLANACGHGRGTVTVRVRDTGGVLALDVEDEGPGIADDRPLFERRPEDATGHGIGLALARSLAEAEGGRLFVSRPRPHPRFTWLIAAPPADGASPADG
ncbi:sensor histidine kinase [Streptomyces scopuliridis]|uniref:sensor histidine kinase n=1 Tax=Streptomyces scopuliridis TaxID=452529 RepID=UPI0010578722|nr:ATP-binding protein [Streptomyces scopuliridis]